MTVGKAIELADKLRANNGFDRELKILWLRQADAGLRKSVVEKSDTDAFDAVGADVLCQEPPETECRLASHPRAVVTPHVGWLARETRERLLKLVAGNIMAYAAGHPQNRVI